MVEAYVAFLRLILMKFLKVNSDTTEIGSSCGQFSRADRKLQKTEFVVCPVIEPVVRQECMNGLNLRGSVVEKAESQ